MELPLISPSKSLAESIEGVQQCNGSDSNVHSKTPHTSTETILRTLQEKPSGISPKSLKSITSHNSRNNQENILPQTRWKSAAQADGRQEGDKERLNGQGAGNGSVPEPPSVPERSKFRQPGKFKEDLRALQDDVPGYSEPEIEPDVKIADRPLVPSTSGSSVYTKEQAYDHFRPRRSLRNSLRRPHSYTPSNLASLEQERQPDTGHSTQDSSARRNSVDVKALSSEDSKRAERASSWSSDGLKNIRETTKAAIAGSSLISDISREPSGKLRRFSFLRSSKESSKSWRNGSQDTTDGQDGSSMNSVAVARSMQRQKLLEELVLSEEGYVKDLMILTRVRQLHEDLGL